MMERIELTPEDDLEEITRAMREERSTKEVFSYAQENAEKRLAELKIIIDAWWNRFMEHHGLTLTLDTPQYRIIHSAQGVYVEVLKDGRPLKIDNKTNDDLIEALIALARKK